MFSWRVAGVPFVSRSFAFRFVRFSKLGSTCLGDLVSPSWPAGWWLSKFNSKYLQANGRRCVRFAWPFAFRCVSCAASRVLRLSLLSESSGSLFYLLSFLFCTYTWFPLEFRRWPPVRPHYQPCKGKFPRLADGRSAIPGRGPLGSCSQMEAVQTRKRRKGHT